ncbi:MDR family MFS transporter [Paenibacillus glycanilyticus]|uniref:Multidrug resistance protein n=1 Tax=Paenibacillus glycanilyticus TaxID=126569 RepID=A0ABQ6G931_9BACL|nr:MFS transporter [Paenibacillus glycanilyticus]GLX65801.1 multidrug resistance protein [Paenibacillus glycanilyticus]
MRIRDWDQNLKIRLLGESGFNIIFWIFFPYLSIYFAQSFGKSWTGILLILSQALSVLVNLTGGYFADRLGRKKVMVFAAGGQAIGYGVFAVAASPWLTIPTVGFAGFTFASLCGTLYWPASQAMVADVVPEEQRSGVFAVFYTAVNMAVVVGPLIGATFFLDSPHIVLFAASAVCLLVALLLASFTRETLSADAIHTKRSTNEPWHKAVTDQLRDYKVIASDRVFLLFIVAGVLLSQTFMQLDLLFPVFLKETIHSTTVLAFGDWNLQLSGEKLFGLIVSENGLFVALFTVAVTKWMMQYRDRFVFIGSALFYAVGIAMFGQMSAFWGLTAAIVVFTLAELMTAGPQQTFVSRLAPEHMRGQYFAASSLRFTIGRTLAPISIPLSEWIGYDGTFGLLTVLAVLSAVIYYIMFNQYEKQSA